MQDAKSVDKYNLFWKIQEIWTLFSPLFFGLWQQSFYLNKYPFIFKHFDFVVCRPGRLEVQVEISLPDENGRLQILQIHTNKMKENSFLSPDVNLQELGMYSHTVILWRGGANVEGVR